MEPLPGASYERLAFEDRGGVEFGLTKQTLDGDCLKRRIHDELSDDGIAAEVPFRRGEQLSGFDLAENEPQIEIASLDEFDFVAADFAEISLIALCHVGRRIW